ncbi:alpha/beta hydrolase-fold protein [Xanthovirga aplysinae]|uniref:alpha/beta hydrolase-fold protein n=1 Tax=Xanthovirga aplysinae TaxID=2529853 RepID=UPI0012BC8C9A|nr:alpha/beta hydrolase-fold protein [Xanthovirga aplysinae]MTI32279.1 hypothetical protein [Xanthovirga aplysinae]
MKKLISVFILLTIICLQVSAQKFKVSYSSELIQEDFTGNIILYLSKDNKSPKDIIVGLQLTPVYRIVADNLKAGEVALFDDHSISYPVELSNIERGEYYAQVVFDRNLGGQSIASSVGNIYSIPVKVNLSKDFDHEYDLKADQIIEEVPFKGTEFLKELSVRSKLLSDFHKKEIFVNAAVSLPKEYYENPDAQYPVIFSIFGFGGSYKTHSGKGKYKFTHIGDSPVIVVYLDGNCPEGHSTYANSDVNGPWGDALVKEFIPALNEKYRTNNAMFLFGHSSGGWSSLWLQINYPKIFAGTWSSAPDQVDFRNYQNKNIYESKSMFYDEQGNLFSDFTIAGRFPIVSSKDFYRIEKVIYRGTQMNSFDAVFGGYDQKGNRIRLVNLPSGEINSNALPLWKRFDISLLLRENWDDLKDDLEGKIRVSIGESDNFHLQHSVHLLDNEMKKLIADIEFGYFPGDHFTVFTKEYQKRGQEFLEKCYKNWLDENI